MTNSIPLEELRFRAVRDPELLVPGTLVILAHVPDLDKGGYGGEPMAEIGTVREMRFHYEDNGDGTTNEVLKIHYFDKHGEHETYASDRGVIPYPAGHFNEANFVVVVADLIAADIEVNLKVSEDYTRRRALINSPRDYNSRDYDHFGPYIDGDWSDLPW